MQFSCGGSQSNDNNDLRAADTVACKSKRQELLSVSSSAPAQPPAARRCDYWIRLFRPLEGVCWTCKDWTCKEFREGPEWQLRVGSGPCLTQWRLWICKNRRHSTPDGVPSTARASRAAADGRLQRKVRYQPALPFAEGAGHDGFWPMAAR